MKRYLIAIVMVLALSMNAGAAAQKHRHTPRTEQVDTLQNKPDAIEAYSDTTSQDSGSYTVSRQVTYQHSAISDDDARVVREVMEGLGGVLAPGIIGDIFTLFVLFLLAPLLIIFIIFYFVNRNRRERYKLAQMAIQNGQPIPEDILKSVKPAADNDDYRSGIRQMFLGLGLAVFLGFAAGKIGFGIGALVFFIGLGKWVIARQNRNTAGDSFGGHVNNSNNNSNIQNYD